MLVLKNVGSNESIGVIKRVFDLGYDILQKELDAIFCDCDASFNLCVFYYNEFYHSEYNDKNISEYEAMINFKNNNEVSIEEWLKRIQLMFQICQYYDYTLYIDIQTMTIYVENKEYKYWYNTMSEFASNWIVRLIDTNKEIGFNKFKHWTDKDINRLREMEGIKKQTFTNLNKEELVMKKYFVLCSEDGNNSILSCHDTYKEACTRLKEEAYSYKEEAIKNRYYLEEDIKVSVDYDTILPSAELVFPDGSVYMNIYKFNI